MKREIISISDNGIVTVAGETKMTISEIANLFGIFYQTARGAIRSIEKSGVADGDYSMTCTVEGLKVYPDYYGLEMVVAVAFRVHTYKAKIFRRWVIGKTIKKPVSALIVLKASNSQILN